MCGQSNGFTVESGQVDDPEKHLSLCFIPIIRHSEEGKSWFGMVEQGTCQLAIKGTDNIKREDGCSYFIRAMYHCNETDENKLFDLPYIGGFLEEGSLSHMISCFTQHTKLFGFLR